MKFNKLKIGICYFVMIATGLVYVVSQTLLYSYNSEQEVLKEDVAKKKDEYDKLMVKINTSNSRENIIKENSNLEIRDNIYYLEHYE